MTAPTHKWMQFKDLNDTLTDVPASTHLIIELTSNNFIYIEGTNQVKAYHYNVSTKTETELDIDPNNVSGDNKSRTQKIQAVWHDRNNTIIWFVDCDNPGNDFDVWKLDYSVSETTPTITEVGTSSGGDAGTVYVWDIFISNSNVYVYNKEDRTGTTTLVIWDVDTAPFTEKDTIVADYNNVTYGVIDSSNNGWWVNDDTSNNKLIITKYNEGTSTLSAKNDLAAYSLNASENYKGLIYDNVNGIIYFVANKDSDSENYLMSYNISADTIVDSGAKYNIGLMLDRNNIGSGVLKENEKGFDITATSDRAKLYIMSKGKDHLSLFQKIVLDSGENVIAITDTILITDGKDIYQLTNLFNTYVKKCEITAGIKKAWECELWLSEEPPDSEIEDGIYIIIYGSITSNNVTNTDVRIFEGPVLFEEESNIIILLCKSPAYFDLKGKITAGKYSGNTDAILSDIFDDNFNYITAGTMSSGTAMGDVEHLGSKTGENVINSYAQIDEFIWSIMPDEGEGDFYYNAGTVDSGESYSEADKLGGFTIIKNRIIINQVNLKGAIIDGEPLTSTANNLDSQKTYGVLPMYRTFAYINNQTTLDNLASSILTLQAQTPYTYKFYKKIDSEGIVFPSELITLSYSPKNVSSGSRIVTNLIYHARAGYCEWEVSDYNLFHYTFTESVHKQVDENNEMIEELSWMSFASASEFYVVYNDTQLDEAITEIQANDIVGIIYIAKDISNVQISFNDASAGLIIDGLGHLIDCDGDNEIFNIDACSTLTIKNLKIDATDLTTSTKAIIDIDDPGDNPVYLEDIEIEGDGTNGIGIQLKSNHVVVSNCLFKSLNFGIELNGSNYNRIYGNEFNSCVEGIKFTANVEQCAIYGNVFTSCSTYGLDLAANTIKYNEITGNLLYQNGISVYLNSALNNAIGNNAIYDPGTVGISLSATAHYNTLNANVIVGVSENDATSRYGIYLNTSDNNIILGNNISSFTNSGDGVGYGIYVNDSGSEKNIIKENVLSGNDWPIWDAGSNTDIEYYCTTATDIQNAIDSIGNKSGTIKIGTGTITLSATIDVDGGGDYIIEGQGINTILAVSGDINIFNITSVKSCFIKNIKLDLSNYTAVDSIGILINETSNNKIILEDIVIIGDNVNGIGIQIKSDNSIIRNCNITNIAKGIEIYTDYCWIFDNYCSSCADTGIYFNGNLEFPTKCYYLQVKGNQCLNNTNYGIYITTFGYGVLYGNICNSNKYGIYITNADYNLYIDNTCINNTEAGFYMKDSNMNSITGNNCSFNDDGIRLKNADGNNIVSNICISNTSNDADVHAGILIERKDDNTGSINNTISSNVSQYNQNAGAGIGYGLYIGITCSSNKIVGNILIGNDTNYVNNGTNTILFGDDTAYGASWNGDLGTPTKNAVYDKINSMTEGGAGTDTTAIHDNETGEIHAITEKTTPVSADEIIIEDSASSYNKKRVQIGNLDKALQLNDLAEKDHSSLTNVGEDDHHNRQHAITNSSDHTAGNDKIFYSDNSGAITELGLGSSGTYLKSQGAGSAPTWDTPSGGSFENPATEDLDMDEYKIFDIKTLDLLEQSSDPSGESNKLKIFCKDDNRLYFIDENGNRWLVLSSLSYDLDYGFYGGGYTGSSSNVIDYIDITTTTGNATDRGDLTVARRELTGVSGSTYGFYGGGYTSSYSNVIDYIDITITTGNAFDKGDLTVARRSPGGVSGSTYGFYGGGYTGSNSNVIDYIDITITTGNATDRGDLTVARQQLAGVSGSTYGFYGGGYSGSNSNVIDYIDITITTGNATDRGDLTVARRGPSGISGSTYGFYAGGHLTLNIIDYIDITITTGNAIDRGDLTVGRRYMGSISGSTYGFYGGGNTGSYSNVIDYIDITITTGNAFDKGDLTVARESLGGVPTQS